MMNVLQTSTNVTVDRVRAMKYVPIQLAVIRAPVLMALQEIELLMRVLVINNLLPVVSAQNLEKTGS